jgi:hypothetical protein
MLAPVEMKPASLASLAAFVAVLGFVCLAFTLGTHAATRRLSGTDAAAAATRRFLLGAAAWLAAFSALFASGAILTRPFPLLPITFALMNLAALTYGCSRAGKQLALGLPIPALVAFQGFRLPLELVLHSWGTQGVIPMSMTWEGENLDVITGVVALVAAPFAARPAIAWGANLVGIVLLANVARVALMSSPLPFAWPVEPKLLLVGYLPYGLIAPVCVAGALAGHVVLTRRLLHRSAPEPSR